MLKIHESLTTPSLLLILIKKFIQMSTKTLTIVYFAILYSLKNQVVFCLNQNRKQPTYA